MTYLALDLSKTSTGWAWWDGDADLPRYGCWPLGSEYTSEGGVFAKLHQQMNDLRRVCGFEIVFIERPIHPAQLAGSTSINSIRLASGLAAHAHSFVHAVGCRTIMEFSPEAWRPGFIGTIESQQAKAEARQAKRAGDKRASARNALKALTMARCRQLGMNPKKDDAADAIGILTHGCLVRGVQPPWLSDEVLRAPLGAVA